MLFVLTAVQFIHAQNPPEIQPLEIGKPLAREIAGGQKHLYQITLAENQYAELKVEQRGADVVIRLLEANGKIAAEYDFDPRSKGEEPIETTAKRAGNYQFSVETRQRNAKGAYEIRLVGIRPATEKELAIDETRKFLTEANRLWRLGDYDAALPLAERILAMREKELGAETYDVGAALFVLANIWGDKGDYAKSEVFYRRALEIREKAMGKDHFSVGSILNNFGTLYKDKGEYEKAETLLLRALEIREKTLEPNHLLIASVLINLGNVAKDKGDVEKAAAYYQKALEIREKALGAETLEVAATLNNIANLYDTPEKAEKFYLRALAIREKILGADHQDVGQNLYNLAVLYGQNDNYAKAKLLGERALEILEKKLGAEHPFTSYPLNLLGIIYKNTGEPEKAEAFYLRSAAIKEKKQGAYHPHLAGVFSNLATLYALRGEIGKAIETQTRANEIFEYNITLNLAAGSEREKISYLKTVSDSESRTLSLHLSSAPDSPEAADLAATAILQRKGRVLDAMSDNLASLRRRFNAQDRILLDKLNETTTQMVGFILAGSQGAADEYQQKIKAFEQEREKLETEISRQSAGFYQKTKPVTLDAVRATIPDNAALIEIAVYRPVSPKASEFSLDSPAVSDKIGKPRYVAYVIRRQGEVKFKDLGEAAPIDENVKLFRQALRDAKRSDVQTIARDLDKKIMSPLRAFWGDAEHLLISADGNLNLIPFEALVDENSKYLIENQSFTYLTGGRDLLRLQVARENKNKPLVIANPLFGDSAVLTNSGARSANTYFAPLGGTLQEARAIQTIFPEAIVLNGAQAAESALKQAAAPGILHVATHGFFLEESRISKNESTKIENPLLRSGLALAGANRRRDGKDDGILTALEASGLNLWGTKLVVLSACDTGLGEVRSGEGVYGLRRAFVLAGTESMVMSLWSVSDYVTRELMTGYYKNLKAGMGRNSSLRSVQLEMLKKPNRRHPFYWASFIQTGEWANLQSRR